MHFSFRRMTAAAALVGPIIGAATTAFAEHERVVFDNHGGRPGGTGKPITFATGDPLFRVEPPGKCGKPFLGGPAFGHPDPRLKDPKAVCGHGIVFLKTHGPDVGRRPLLILPVSTAPVDPERDAVAAASSVALDPAKLLREQLPRLDAAAGDAIPAVVELRKAIRARDVAKAMMSAPKPMPERRAD